MLIKLGRDYGARLGREGLRRERFKNIFSFPGGMADKKRISIVSTIIQGDNTKMMETLCGEILNVGGYDVSVIQLAQYGQEPDISDCVEQQQPDALLLSVMGMIPEQEAISHYNRLKQYDRGIVVIDFAPFRQGRISIDGTDGYINLFKERANLFQALPEAVEAVLRRQIS